MYTCMTFMPLNIPHWIVSLCHAVNKRIPYLDDDDSNPYT